MVQSRLGPGGKAVSSLIFNLLSLAYVALTDWYFLQLVMSSYRRDAQASTSLATPLWIPETVMIVGATMLLSCWSRPWSTISGGSRREPGPRSRPRHGAVPRPAGAGMTIPFAIGVPAIAYLLLHGGIPALQGIGLMSWGTMNSFARSAPCRCSS